MKREAGLWWIKVAGDWICVGSMRDAFTWTRDIANMMQQGVKP